MDFAVTIKGIHEEGKGSWVLEVDGDQVLISHEEDMTLHWHPFSDCRILKVGTPETPRPVYTVQVQPQNGLVTARPQDNRMARRRRGA